MDIIMPQLGETVTEGTITRWLKHVGDRVEADEPLFEVSTDKVDSEVPAASAGFLTEIRIPEGATAAVGDVLAVVGDTLAPEAHPAVPTEPVTRPEAIVSPAEPPAVSPTSEPIVAAVPVAPPAPTAPAPPPSFPEPSPPLRSTPRAVAPAARAAGAAELTSPVVRRLIAEHGLDPSQIRGTGEGGRITRNDVLDAASTSGDRSTPSAPTPPSLASSPPPPPVPSPPPPAPMTEAPTAPSPVDMPSPAAPPIPRVARIEGEPATEPTRGDEVLAFSNIRRRTAEHMIRSKATSAHAYTSIEVDYEHVANIRERHQDTWRTREGFPLTYLPFVARAFGDAVSAYPHVNASVVDESLVVHRDVHLGIAVDLDFDGLVVPVIRNADGKRLRLLAREIRDLAERARTKQLLPDEVLGGTVTITNPGLYGTYMTLPIINQPQVAVLSTDGVRKHPVVVSSPDGADSIAVRHVGILTLGWDHRAFDGAYAAAFLRALKDDLERRDWEAELA